MPATRARPLPSFLLLLLLTGFFISWRLRMISRSRKGISWSSWFSGLQFTFFFPLLRGLAHGAERCFPCGGCGRPGPLDPAGRAEAEPRLPDLAIRTPALPAEAASALARGPAPRHTSASGAQPHALRGGAAPRRAGIGRGAGPRLESAGALGRAAGDAAAEGGPGSSGGGRWFPLLGKYPAGAGAGAGPRSEGRGRQRPEKHPCPASPPPWGRGCSHRASGGLGSLRTPPPVRFALARPCARSLKRAVPPLGGAPGQCQPRPELARSCRSTCGAPARREPFGGGRARGPDAPPTNWRNK